MPTVPAMPPADRFFARLIRFECSCPSCGQVIASEKEQGYIPAALTKTARQRARRNDRPLKQAQQLVWNAYTQRLRCPRCRNRFVAGLLLYPSASGGLYAPDPPSDTVPTPRERRALRAAAGGYVLDATYQGQPVNLHVPAPCSCPPKGWVETCPIHGRPQPAPTVPHESLT